MRILLIFFATTYLNSVYGDESQIVNQEVDDAELSSIRIYRNPEERREAGLGTELTEWLTFSGLLEVEKEYFEDNFSNGKKNREYGDAIPTLQFAFELSFNEWLGAELIYEAELDEGQENAAWDEAFLYLDLDDLNIGVEIGRVSVPFGEYYSHFVTGPLLEFGETIRNGLIVDYSVFNFLEVNAFVIDSDVEKENKSTDYDWGVGIEYVSKTESIRAGVGYLSDLAESDERFLRDENDLYIEKVSAWNAHALIGFETFEITAEVVIADDQFREFEANEDKPLAYNVELSYFLSSNMQMALRYEGSDELSDQPAEQYGISVSWRPIDRLNVTGEYLHGRYKNDFVFDDDENELNDRDLFAAQLAIEF